MADFDTPKSLRAAIEYLYDGMSARERRDFVFWGSVAFHSGLGRQIRNAWGLWSGSPLKLHFKAVWGIGHADDMSSMILDGLEHRINGTVFDAAASAEKFKRYWLRQFINPLNMERIVF